MSPKFPELPREEVEKMDCRRFFTMKEDAKRAPEAVVHEPSKRTWFERAIINIAKSDGSSEDKWDAVMQQLLELL